MKAVAADLLKAKLKTDVHFHFSLPFRNGNFPHFTTSKREIKLKKKN